MTPDNSKARRWLERLGESRRTYWILSVMSFLETIIVPIPIEIVLVPFMLGNRPRIWIIAAVTTAGCLVGALVGYAAGFLFYQSVGQWLIETVAEEATYDSVKQLFDQHGFWAILAIGIIPIPFQLAMVTAGWASYPLHLFVVATLIARGVRYFGLAWLVYAFGEKVREAWKRHAVLTSLVAIAILATLVVGGNFAANRLL